jgi:hypothetical protein
LRPPGEGLEDEDRQEEFAEDAQHHPPLAHAIGPLDGQRVEEILPIHDATP